jgi:hypothetical protein
MTLMALILTGSILVRLTFQTLIPGTTGDRPNYLAFLVVLKNLLLGKSISIAAPASY